jgi:hypothetical protein
MARTQRTKKIAPARTAAPGYLERSQQPLQSLIFLLPLVAFYELGTLIYVNNNAHGPTSFIYARSLLRDFFDLFGASAYYLPAAIVIAVLVALHITRGDPWRCEPKLYGLMALEALTLAVPLFVFGLVIARRPEAAGVIDETIITPLQHLATNGGSSPDASGPGTWQARLVFSIGAGIYEELLFRLIAIALLHLLLVDVLALPEHVGAFGAVGGSAIAFALYHFSSDNPFSIGLALYYTGTGVYFAGVYVLRGFGIVAATHALYDVYIVLYHLWHIRHHG